MSTKTFNLSGGRVNLLYPEHSRPRAAKERQASACPTAYLKHVRAGMTCQTAISQHPNKGSGACFPLQISSWEECCLPLVLDSPRSEKSGLASNIEAELRWNRWIRRRRDRPGRSCILTWNPGFHLTGVRLRHHPADSCRKFLPDIPAQ
jgi:hypothetical protein